MHRSVTSARIANRHPHCWLPLKRGCKRRSPAPQNSRVRAFLVTRVGQLPAARYASSTEALMRPREFTVMPLEAAQARTAAGSKPLKSLDGFSVGAEARRPPEVLRATET